jgi:hypothetical protein
VVDKVKPAGINNGSFVGAELHIIKGVDSSPVKEVVRT